MYKLCVFGGTTEGRELVEFLNTQPCRVTACVATEYGQTLLPEGENLTVSARPLPVGAIGALLQAERFDLVIDATHPYAASITRSIAAACEAAGVEHWRLLRGASEAPEDAVFAENTDEAVRFLSGTEGNILLTTGSKELSKFATLPDFAARCWARVLPLPASLEACSAAGLSPSHIFALQGPFSREMDEAMLHRTSARWLVTKDGGAAGGFQEKAAAARHAGARLLVIGRPAQETGSSLPETIGALCARFGFSCRPQVTIVGIGPGSEAAQTGEVRAAIRAADALIGARRMLDAVCWDVGAGTGSVAIEMALQAARGSVWAIEREADALTLLEQNRAAFGAENLRLVSGSAPEVCRDLPAPTHAFLGGTGGQVREILQLLLEKNPHVRIVATAVTLESAAALTACMREFEFCECVSLSIAKARAAGPYHLMAGQNPIYIFTLQNGGNTP